MLLIRGDLGEEGAWEEERGGRLGRDFRVRAWVKEQGKERARDAGLSRKKRGAWS